MTLSGLFEDEPDFRDISSNQALLEDMVDQLPDIMVELYLLFRSADEKNGRSRGPKK